MTSSITKSLIPCLFQQMKRGFTFESETDTETIAKLMKHIYDKHPDMSFRELVENCIQQLEGAFALAFKSKHFPGEIVVTRYIQSFNKIISSDSITYHHVDIF